MATKAKISQHSANMKRVRLVFLLLHDEHCIRHVHCYQYAFVHLFLFLLLVIKLLVVINFKIAMNCTVTNCCSLILPFVKEFVIKSVYTPFSNSRLLTVFGE